MKLEIKKIGNSCGIILPKELLTRLGLNQGDQVFITEGPDKSFNVGVFNDDDRETMEIARDVMRECRTTLKKRAE